MILYFTGTGNSAYVAEGLGHALNDEVICANHHIKHSEKGEYQSEKPYIFVFPVYLSTMAQIFAKYIEESTFHGSDRAYFVGTCASEIGSSPNAALELCRKKGWQYMGTEKVVMPQNYIALFSMTAPAEIEKRLHDANGIIQSLSAVVLEEQPFSRQLTKNSEYRVVKWVEWLYNKYFTTTKPFYTTDKCVSCGLCANVCPLNRIELQQGRPRWDGSCIHCMACINRCPKGAIEYGKKTAGKPRYVCQKYEISVK